MAPHAEPEAVTDTQSFVKQDPILTSGESLAVYSIEDVVIHRQTTSKTPSIGIAAFSDADMFKSKRCFRKPKAKRWDHRLSAESKARSASSLKGAMRHFKPETISLCGGLPSRYV